jgi:hypothetical protein
VSRLSVSTETQSRQIETLKVPYFYRINKTAFPDITVCPALNDSFRADILKQYQSENGKLNASLQDDLVEDYFDHVSYRYL